MAVVRRIDTASHQALTDLANQGASAFGWRAELSVDAELAELLRLRVSQLNNCTYCLLRHHEVARDLGIPQAKLDTLTAWWETELHTPAEQAALAYAEALTRADDTTVAGRFQQYHDALVEHFTAEQILDIVGVVINMNIWTRLKLAEGFTPS